jgi:hypothetical protein
MIREVKMYEVVCDNCGIIHYDGDENLIYESSDSATGDAENNEWHIKYFHAGHWPQDLCPTCYNLVINQNRKK